MNYKIMYSVFAITLLVCHQTALGKANKESYDEKPNKHVSDKKKRELINGRPFKQLYEMTKANSLAIEELYAMTAANSQAIEDLYLVTERLTVDIESIGSDIHELEQSLVITMSAVGEINTRLTFIEDNLVGTQNDVSTLFSEVSELKTTHENDITMLTNTLNLQRSQVDDLRAEMRQAIINLSSEIQIVKDEISANGGNLQAALAAIAANTAEILEMNVMLDDHESRLTTVESSINILSDEIEDIEQRVDNIAIRLTGIDTAISDLQNSALPPYAFSGVRQNIPQASLSGWRECHSELYATRGTPLETIQSQCNGSWIMLACRAVGSPELRVAANARRNDVFSNTGPSATHVANNVQWYYDTNWSMGFAPTGETVTRQSCDIDNRDSNDRVCHHTRNGALVPGWRCGNAVNLTDSLNFERVFLTTDQ